MADAKSDEERYSVTLTNLDQPLFDGAGATKRDLVEYLDAVADRILPVLEDRPLSVIRVHRGQEVFMQKNVPKYTPEWVPTVTMWAESWTCPTPCATTAARCCGSPTSGRWSTTRPWYYLCGWSRRDADSQSSCLVPISSVAA